VFGMVPLEINVGSNDGINNYSLIEMIKKEVSLPDLSIGEVMVNADNSRIEVHTSKVEYVIPAINKANSMNRELVCKLANHSSS